MVQNAASSSSGVPQAAHTFPDGFGAAGAGSRLIAARSAAYSPPFIILKQLTVNLHHLLHIKLYIALVQQSLLVLLYAFCKALDLILCHAILMKLLSGNDLI